MVMSTGQSFIESTLKRLLEFISEENMVILEGKRK